MRAALPQTHTEKSAGCVAKWCVLMMIGRRHYGYFYLYFLEHKLDKHTAQSGFRCDTGSQEQVLTLLGHMVSVTCPLAAGDMAQGGHCRKLE